MTGLDIDMPATRIRIRLLGRFEVRRADGTPVAEREFRTRKTADLLCLLALHNGAPVLLSDVVDRLWPDASAGHALASVRTAASQIRRAVGADCVGRQPGALLLRGAWVDVDQFLADAARAQHAARIGDDQRAYVLTLACERLYLGDLHAHVERTNWLAIHREHLAQQRLRTLCTGAAAALRLGRHEAARDLAATATTVDRWSEAARRLLMQAYGELGEMGNALHVFQALRADLAEEFGADPSPQTQELHLRLLRAGRAP